MAFPLLSDPRPWAFSLAELTAGLRSHAGDPTLAIRDIQEQEMPQRRPAVGRIRGLRVACEGAGGARLFTLVLKEPQGITRIGTAGAGLREVSFYRNLIDQLPIRVPRLVAAHPDGEWLALDLLPGGFDPARWTPAEYLLAASHLAALHDRFWGLGEDLTAYPWLGRPLTADFEIHVKAAAAGIQRLADQSPHNLLARDPSLMAAFARLVAHADKIRDVLRAAPSTLLHGDYFPGNLYLYPDGSLVAFDWQQAAIGPGILDLLYFVQSSRWWFDPLPLSADEIVARYRAALAQTAGHSWDSKEWAALWDYALLWTFLSSWIDLLEIVPNSLLQTRYAQLEALWLEPVRAAVARWLPEA